MTTLRSTVAMAMALLPQFAEATSVCRWVDDAGRTQLTAVVPDRYKAAATCTDAQQYELPAAQRRAAEQRAAQDRARALQAAQRPAAEGASSASSARGPAGAASRPGAKRPTEAVTAATDCATWWRIYDESVACFGPYRTTRGATKPEAFDSCNVVPSPEVNCGPRSR